MYTWKSKHPYSEHFKDQCVVQVQCYSIAYFTLQGRNLFHYIQALHRYNLIPVAQASTAQADANIIFKLLTTRMNHAAAWKAVELQLWSNIFASIYL